MSEREVTIPEAAIKAVDEIIPDDVASDHWMNKAVEAAAPHIDRAARIDELKRLRDQMLADARRFNEHGSGNDAAAGAWWAVGRIDIRIAELEVQGMKDDLRSTLDDIAYSHDSGDSDEVGATRKCQVCSTNLKLGVFIRAKVWYEADIERMSVAHTKGRCDVIAGGGDPDYRPPTPPREPQCKSRLTWVEGDWMHTRHCSQMLGHRSGMHGGRESMWTDDQADPPGITREGLWALRAPKPNPDEMWSPSFGCGF